MRCGSPTSFTSRARSAATDASSYIDWARRVYAYLYERQNVPHPRVDSGGVRDCLTQLAVRRQVSASTQNQAGCALLLNGVDVRQIQEYLGHANVETTMIHTHVVKEVRNPARSPLDNLHAHQDK